MGSISTPQWSADGATIFAAVDQAGENVVIGVSLQSLETTRVALPRHEGNLCWDLSLSPNGKRFASCRGRRRGSGRFATLDDSDVGRASHSAHGRTHGRVEPLMVE